MMKRGFGVGGSVGLDRRVEGQRLEDRNRLPAEGVLQTLVH